MREIPTGTAYAVWVGIGAPLALAYGMIFDGNSVRAIKILLIVGLVDCCHWPKGS